MKGCALFAVKSSRAEKCCPKSEDILFISQNKEMQKTPFTIKSITQALDLTIERTRREQPIIQAKAAQLKTIRLRYAVPGQCSWGQTATAQQPGTAICELSLYHNTCSSSSGS